MYNRTTVRLWCAVAVAGTFALGGCRENPLSVPNPNNPDVAKVYGTPKDVETIVSKLFQQMWDAQQGNIGIGAQSTVMSFESHSSLANFGMGARANIPRGPVSNDLGNSDQDIIYNDFDKLTRNVRSGANAVAALNSFIAANAAIGRNNAIGTAAKDARAISFGYFVIGYGLGNTALLYDSAAIITPDVPPPPADLPLLSTAPAVMTAALKMLDSALKYSATADPIPAAWMSQPIDVTVARWQQIIHSYKARFRAGIARTPTERNAVDWNAVVNDALAGITTDFEVTGDATHGWNSAWQQQFAVDATWSQMTPFILGMGDTTGAYDAWLATPLDSRTPFLLRTPDIRFPSGETRTAQQAVTGTAKTGTPVGTILYFRNRPGGDDSQAYPWGTWYYDNWRFWQLNQKGGNGPPILAFSLAERDMLTAEGYMRTARTALAVPLINFYRTRAGLAAIPAGTTDQTTPVPFQAGSTTACVPRVPVGPGFTTTACGSVYEAMKWEKRLETAFTGYAQWFIDSRGWGDLTQGTITEWPVPWQELYARGKNLTVYTTLNSRAAKGTYGF